MPRKFSIGNKVLIKRMDERTPKYILKSLRLDHPRTIIATFYDNKAQHTRYYLGTNKRGDIDISFIHFRASQLQLWAKGKIGRPSTRRHYTRHILPPNDIIPATAITPTRGYLVSPQGVLRENHHKEELCPLIL